LVDSFLWAGFWKNTGAHIFGLLFPLIALILSKKTGWATIWVVFFTNSSGHPGFEA
jgi:hypothetical protein